jgi:hypothetical protein
MKPSVQKLFYNRSELLRASWVIQGCPKNKKKIVLYLQAGEAGCADVDRQRWDSIPLPTTTLSA